MRIARQPDSKVIVAGDFDLVDGVARRGICRLDPDGSLDLSFDSGPAMTLPPDQQLFPSSVYSLALQPDGKILVRGNFISLNRTSSATTIIRYNVDGSQDLQFVPDTAAQQAGPDSAAMAVQSGGKILLAEDISLARLESSGAADATFKAVEVSGVAGWGSAFNLMVVENDGRVLFEGNVDPPVMTGVPRRGMTRLNLDGSIDESFKPMMDSIHMNAAAVQPDGKIVIAGGFSQVNGLERQGLARLNADGSTDTSFAPSNEEAYFGIQVVGARADGQILVATGDGSLFRLNADGSRDSAFDIAAGGFKRGSSAGTIFDLIVQPDGRIWVAGNFTSVNGNSCTSLVRLNGDDVLASSRPHFHSLVGVGTGDVGTGPRHHSRSHLRHTSIHQFDRLDPICHFDHDELPACCTRYFCARGAPSVLPRGPDWTVIGDCVL